MLCDCSVTAVGSERLPFLSINNALAPLVFSQCCMKRRPPSDVSSGGWKCLLNALRLFSDRG